MQMDEARHSTLAILAEGECGGEVRAVSTVGAVGDDLARLIPRLLFPDFGVHVPDLPPWSGLGVCRADRPAQTLPQSVAMTCAQIAIMPINSANEASVAASSTTARTMVQLLHNKNRP